MSAERWIFALLPLLALCSLGAWRSLQGDDAGFLLLALMAVVTGLGVVAFVHRRRLPKAGPPDPSKNRQKQQNRGQVRLSDRF